MHVYSPFCKKEAWEQASLALRHAQSAKRGGKRSF